MELLRKFNSTFFRHSACIYTLWTIKKVAVHMWA